MKFNINQQDFQKSLNYCQGVIEKRSTLPILSNVLLNASQKNLTITATDLAMELTENLVANVIQAGGITIPSQLFFDIIRKAPDQSEIKLKNDEKNKRLSCAS